MAFYNLCNCLNIENYRKIKLLKEDQFIKAKKDII